MTQLFAVQIYTVSLQSLILCRNKQIQPAIQPSILHMPQSVLLNMDVTEIFTSIQYSLDPNDYLLTLLLHWSITHDDEAQTVSEMLDMQSILTELITSLHSVTMKLHIIYLSFYLLISTQCPNLHTLNVQCNINTTVIFQVLMAASIKMWTFWAPIFNNTPLCHNAIRTVPPPPPTPTMRCFNLLSN